MKIVYQITKAEDGFLLRKYIITKHGLSCSYSKQRWETKKELIAECKKIKLKIVNDKQFFSVLQKVML